MKKTISKILLFGVIVCSVVMLGSATVFAEDEVDETTPAPSEEEEQQPGTSISLTPVSKILQIASKSTYDDVFVVTNGGNDVMKIETYAAPYSYVYSEEEESYKLGFNTENNYTQMSRWITFKDTSGKFVEKAYYSIEPGKSLEITYRISTPSNIPGGGQYAVIFAHAFSTVTSTSGIRTEASPGMIVYGRSLEGEATVSAEIRDAKIFRGVVNNDKTVNSNIAATAMIKNDGNVDFTAVGVLKVSPIIGFRGYETPANAGRLSVIPETELELHEEWTETPSFGLYKVTWEVTAGEQVETVETLILIASPFAIVLFFIVLTILIVWIIVMVRKRKARRSRLAV